MPASLIPEFIILEGIMGACKSGLAQAIARMMISADVPCRWFFEHEVPNPVGQADDPTL